MNLPWNFSRPGSAWVMDRSGIYVERGPNVPRYQWAPDGRSEGLLIERQGTNGVSNNTSLSAKTGVTAVLTPHLGFPHAHTLTWNTNESRSINAGITETYPFTSSGGSVLAQRIIYARKGGARYVRFGTDAIARVIVVDVQAESIIYRGGDVGGAYMRRIGDWLEIRTSATWLSASHNQFRFSFGSALNGTDGVDSFVGDSIEVAYPSMYDGPDAPYSLLPTTGTPITRPADTIYADMSLVPEFDPTKGTIVVEWVDYSAAGGYFPIFLSSSDTFSAAVDHVRIDRASDGTSIRIVIRADGAGTIGNPPIPTVHGEVTRAAFRYDGATVALSANGSAVTHGTHSENKSPVGLRYLHVGRGCHGLFRLVAYSPYAASDAELQQLSRLS